MRQLAFADAMFLYNETLRTPMHIASVQLMRLPEGMDGMAFTRALQHQVSTRLDRVPYLTERIQETPFQLDHPFFVSTPHLVLTKHIHRVQVDAPGDHAALEITVAKLHQVQLDLSRPLREMVAIDGLADGRVALYSRVHHCCIDGIAGQTATSLIYDSTSKTPDLPASTMRGSQESEHPAVTLIKAFEHFGQVSSANYRSLPTMVRASLKVQERLSGESSGRNGGRNGGLGLAPMSALNRPVGSRRSVAFGTLPLADVKAVGRSVSATLNDVVLAICGGGLRSHFLRTGDLPQEPMLAGCPVSLRRPGDDSLNNQVSMMRVALGTHLQNPLVRLLYTKEASRHARHLVLDAAGLMPPSVALPGLPAAARFAALAGDWFATMDQPLPMPVNVIISNVAGPKEGLFVAGARMESHWPVSIPAHGLPVNLTVQSYDGNLYLGVTACARALPDARTLRDDIMNAWFTLKAMVIPDLPPTRLSIHPLAEPVTSTAEARATAAQSDRQAA